MIKEIQGILVARGFEVLEARRVGQGGQLTAYIADVIERDTGERRIVIVKTTDTKSKLVEALGFPQSASIRSEGFVGDLLAQGGLGPEFLYADGQWAVRKYCSGESLDQMLRVSNALQRQKLVKNAADFLLKLINYLIAREQLVYLDSHSRNLIVDGGRIVLIDHEWAFWRYRDKVEFSAVTLVRFVADLVSNHDFSFTDLFQILDMVGTPKDVIEKCKKYLACKYLANHPVSYASAFIENKELVLLLVKTERFGTAKSVLEAFCDKLRSKSLRYCFARRYDDLWEQGIYNGKDIDIFLHPEDYPDFLLLATELGFSPYKSRCLAYYCEIDEMVLFLDLHMKAADFPHKFFEIEEILARSEVRGRKKFIAAEHLATHLLVNNLQRRRKFTSQHRKDLEYALAKEDVSMTEIKSAISVVFGKSQATAICDLVQRRKWGELDKLGPGKCSSGILEAMRNAKLSAKLSELMYRGPKIVAMLGVDGAGKSSTLRRVRSALSDAGFSSGAKYLGCYYPPSGRGQSFVLPTDKLMLGAFKILAFFRSRGVLKRKIVPTVDCIPEPPEGSLRGERKSFAPIWKVPLEKGGECDAFVFRVYAWVLVVDALLMGVFLRVRSLPEAEHFLFTDRYFYDLITFLGERHLGSSLLARLNEPEVAVFLYATPEVQVAREPRHSVSEISTNQRLYRMAKVENQKLNWVEVSTEIPVGLVVQKVIATCMQAQRKRSFIKFFRNCFIWILSKVRFI